MILECFDENNNDLDTYIAATELQQGWNRILIKCGCSEIDKCNFLVRIVDEHGKRIEGLRVSTETHPYQRRPAAPVTVLEDAFESFFKKQCELYPSRPENYALLAQLYLRNDRAPEAERVLRSALQRWSRCSLFHILMMEAYDRGEKHDEVEELLVRLSAIDSRLPQVLDHRIAQAMRNEDYTRAEELLDQLKKQGYNPEYVYQAELGLLAKRKEFDKLVTLAAEAYAKYPLNWDLANLQAVIESEFHHDKEKAAGVVQTYLTRNYGLVQLWSLADYYLKAGKLDKWEETAKEAIALSPATTGYVYAMGNVYQLVKDYPKAEAAFHQALALCPNSALYWSKLAEVYAATGRKEDAKAAYRTALSYGPQEFGLREALRALEGKQPIFSAFSSFPIDSLVRAAPTQKEYENDDVVVLLDDTKRAVYDRGASMTTSELLVKLFSARGIDAWKEYSIDYNQYTEELIVEKAVTIKRDGTEVKADVNTNDIVFKSLEANDCIYVKWKLKNYYSGMLVKHFWDTHYFNGFCPIRISRYSIMVPKDAHFTHKTQFTPDAPTIREVSDGTLYEWQLSNEPSIRYEYGMPVYSDIAKTLYISSIPSWAYMASWYSDLARTKTRSTFEIRDQVAKLFEGKPNLADEDKVRVVHDFIAENIRYSSVSFRQSNYVPQRARNVLVQRLGDCKDMATLCIAMLNEIGIRAHYVLVDTRENGHNRNVPPGIEFNHFIVGVDLKSGVRHIDLTAST
jgi:tetratricopeptide (TPR) repeat protein